MEGGNRRQKGRRLGDKCQAATSHKTTDKTSYTRLPLTVTDIHFGVLGLSVKKELTLSHPEFVFAYSRGELGSLVRHVAKMCVQRPW
jgi:hypothetical protein